jgi:hypothetical protein
MNEQIPAQADAIREDDELFSSYEEQEEFIRRKEAVHSLARRIQEDAQSCWDADADIIDESEFVLPTASQYGLFADWYKHPNGTHVYGYLLHGFGCFCNEEKTPAGKGVYLSIQPLVGEDEDRARERHAFHPPSRPLVVVNEQVYLESSPETLFQPIRPEDTLWLQLSKAAAMRSCHLKNGKWDERAIADMLTDMLWRAGYDSIYFNSAGRPWVVLLMPGHPLVSNSSEQGGSSLSQPIHVEITVSFKSQKIRRLDMPTASHRLPILPGMTIPDEDREIYDWPGANYKAEIDRHIRIESASMKFFFAQDEMDGGGAPLAEVSCDPQNHEPQVPAYIGQHAVEIETCGFNASKTVPVGLASLSGIKVESEFLAIGALIIGPWDFEDATWDESTGFQWFWNGESLPFHPFHLFNPPRGMAFGEWHKVMIESDYIQRHTSHPLASSRSKVEAIASPDHADFVEWLLMLPEKHLRNLGLLEQTLEWIEHERCLQQLNPVDVPIR